MIPAPRPHLTAAATTHPGMKGKNNEDRYAVTGYLLDNGRRVSSTLAVVCDGIGGHRAGEVAAEIAVNTINQTVADSDGSQPLNILQEAVTNASEAIRSQAESNPSQKGMGATCAIVWIIGERVYTGSVGDSRIYFVRNGEIRQVTTDHTWIQEALEMGALTPEQARGHPNSHVIRRYLGSQQPPDVDFRIRLNSGDTDGQALANQGFRLQPGDQFLLCSDGLTDLVEEDEILAALTSKDGQEAIEDLQNLANRRGGHDNITIVTLLNPDMGVTAVSAPVLSSEDTIPTVASVAVPTAAAPTQKVILAPAQTAASKAQPKPAVPMMGACLGIGVLVLIAALVFGGAAWVLTRATPTPTPEVTHPVIIFGTPTPRVTPTPTATSRSNQTEPPLFPTSAPTTPPPLIFRSTNTPTPWPNTLFPPSLNQATPTSPLGQSQP